MPHMLQRSDDLVLNDCDSPRRLHSRPMASLAPLSPRHPAGLIPSGELWLPRPSLTACLRAAIARSTVGHTLSDAQRINRFPASPLCSLSWWFEGRSEALVAERPDSMPTEHSPREAYPGRWVLAGPQTRPTSSYCAGPTYAMMVLFMPDALHQLTGVDPGALTDRMVDAQSLLPPDWLALCEAVQNLPDNAARLQHLDRKSVV